MIIQTVQELTVLPKETQPRENANGVLLVSPEYFAVEYVINVHMNGNVGKVNKEKALKQWNAVKEAFESINIPYEVIPGVKGLPDHVFVANAGFVYKRGGSDIITVPSRMASDFRKKEVGVFVKWAKSKGYKIMELSDSPKIEMEGMGDLLWHPNRKFLYAGYGYRTTYAAVKEIEQFFEIPIVTMKLVNPRWYHLDTAFAPVNESTVMVAPMAFNAEAQELIRSCFDTVIELTEEDALNFAANAYSSPDGKYVIMKTGCENAKEQLEAAGIQVIEVDTSEYMKSGGSVFCMKLEVYL